MKFTNLMLDLETLSTQPNSVIVTIAAVKFSFDHPEEETFQVNLNPKEGKELGLHIDPDTVEWWRNGDREAMLAWMRSPTSYTDGVTKFHDWLFQDTNSFNPEKAKVWAQGIDFDMPIMRSSFSVIDKKMPWPFWNQCDSRTIFTVAKFNTKQAERVGQYHNAVDDCRTQISWLKHVLQSD
jgi:hypothetical protein